MAEELLQHQGVEVLHLSLPVSLVPPPPAWIHIPQEPATITERDTQVLTVMEALAMVVLEAMEAIQAMEAMAVDMEQGMEDTAPLGVMADQGMG